MTTTKKPQPDYLKQQDAQPNWDAFDSFTAPQAPEKPEQHAGIVRTAGDMAIKGAQGVVDLGAAAVGLGSLATGGLVGEGMRAMGYDPKRTNEILGDYLSDDQKASDAAVQGEDSFLGAAGAAITHPRALAGSIVQSLPGMIAGMGTSAAAARAIGVKAAAAFGGMETEAGARAAAAAIEKAGGKLMAIGSATEGAQSAGQIADDAQAAGRTYGEYAPAAIAGGLGTAAIGFGAGKLMGDAATDIATGSRTLAGSKAAKVGKEVLSEGVLEEMPQSAQEQVFTNIAQGESDLTKGVANAAGSGLVTGGVMGGGMGLLHGGHATAPAPAPLADTGPLSRAANAAQAAIAAAAAPAGPAGAAPAPANMPPLADIDARMAQLVAIGSGSPAQRTTDAAGNRVDVPAVAGRRLTPEEIGEYNQLKTQRAARVAIPQDQQAEFDTLLAQEQAERDQKFQPAIQAAAANRVATEQAAQQARDAAEHAQIAAMVDADEQLRQQTEQVRQQQDLDDIAARVQRENAARAEANRAGLRDDVLADDSIPAEAKKDAFRAALERAGYRAPELTEADHGAIDAAIAPVPSAPNELVDAVPERRTPAPVASAPNTKAVDAAIAAGMRLKSPGGSVLHKPGSTKIFRLSTAQRAYYDKAMERQAGAEAAPAAQNAAAVPESTTSVPQNGEIVSPAAPATALDLAAHAAATSPHNDLAEPTAAQKEAGNYKVGRVTLHGLDISIENPTGSVRRGVDKSGKPWETTMNHHYGYIRGTVGADKDHIDTFIGPNHDSDKVFVVDQIHPDSRKFDEHKVMLGFDSLEEARAAYKSNYDAKWTGGRYATETTVAGFKDWLENGDTKKPFVSLGTHENKMPADYTANSVRNAAAWGFTGADLVPDELGHVPAQFAKVEVIKSKTLSRPGDSMPAASIVVAQAPNGKWTSSSSHLDRGIGRMSGIGAHSPTPAYDSRNAAIQAELDRLKGEVKPNVHAELVAAARLEAAPAAAPANPGVRARLMEIAGRLGIRVSQVNGGFQAGAGVIDVPAEDAKVEAAITPEHVFTHELGHAVMQKRGFSYKGFPKAEMVKRIANWDALTGASKAFRPAAWGHADERIRRHAAKPDEVLADAIGSVLIGEKPLELLAPLMDTIGMTVYDLGLKDVPARAAAAPSAAPAPAPAPAKQLTKQDLNKMTVKDMSDAELLQARDVFAGGARAPKIDKEIAARGIGQQAAEPAAAAAKDEPELPMGTYGTVDQPLRFISGMSAPADFAAAFAADKHVGISINALSKTSIPKIAAAMAATKGSYLFIDSGAFSVFMANMRAKAAHVDEFNDFEEKALDFEAIFDKYEALHKAIGRADDSGFTAERVFFVMPDIVGDQAGSLELVKKYADLIKMGGRNIVPLQGGELTLKQAYETMMRNLGMDPKNDISPVIGIPSKAAAVSDAELSELVKAYGDNIWGIHILGAVADKTLNPRLEVLRAAGYDDGNISADANRLRSLMWGGTPRAEAMRELLHGDGLTKSMRQAAKAQPDEQPAPSAEPGVLANATAPEHVNLGVDDRELGEIVAEFNAAQAEMMEGEHAISNIFQPPAKGEVVRLNDKAKVYHKEHGWMTPAEARAKIEEWKAHAQDQGENDEIRRANSQRVVLSLFDLSGEWSKPWEEAGYQVYRFDIQDDPQVGDVNNFSAGFFGDWFGDFEGLDIYAILAATPCTDFASSGARHFAAKDADGRTVSSVKLVHQTLRTIEYFKPSVWALENPVGRIESLGGLPPWRMSFDPNHLGDPYTKKTLIWGRFNGDLPIAPVEPTEGSKMHKLYGGKSMATKNARSVTPEGFSYGFFMANNAHDNPAMAIANKYDRLDRAGIERAVAAGVTEAEINSAVEDHYYMDLDDDAANQAIAELADEASAPDPEPAPTKPTKSTKKADKESAPAKEAAPAAPAATPTLQAQRERAAWIPPGELKTYTEKEAQALWERGSAGMKRAIMGRVDLRGDDPLAGKTWADMTPAERKLAHAALNEDFFAGSWYTNKQGERVDRFKPATIAPQKSAAQVADERGEQRWGEMTPAERMSALLNLGMGIGEQADQAKFSQWAQMAGPVRAALTAQFDGKSAQTEAAAPAAADKFANNKLFTSDAVEKARARLKSKLGTLNSGIDPELMMDGITIAGAYIELGVRSFAAFSKAMIGDLGEGVRPYLRSFYEGTRHFPGLDTAGMTSAADIDAMEKDATAPHTQPSTEKNEAIGETVKVAPKAKKTTDTVLRDDWGVAHIDGWTPIAGGQNEQTDYGLRGGLKDAFLKDAQNYLRKVSGELQAQGFVPYKDAKGKLVKAVRVNESGTAGSGDVALSMHHPDQQHGIYLHISETAIRGMVPTTKSGIAVMMRVGTQVDQSGARDQNRWMPVNLSAVDLAEQAAKAVQEKAIRVAKLANPVTINHTETIPAPAETKEQHDDSTTSGDAPALDQALADGQRADAPSDAAGKPRAQDGRDDDGVVREPRGRDQGADDARPELGNQRGHQQIPDAAPRAVAGRDERVSADFRPDVGGLTREGSWFDTAARNVDLIELARKIEEEGRAATPAEQAELSKYVGFGASAIRNKLFPIPSGYAKQQDPTRLIWPNLVQEASWRALAERMEALPAAWQKSVLQSSQYAHYTSEGIIRSTWGAMQRLGFTGGKVFEPGMGIGSFAMLMPDSVRDTSRYTGVEFDGPTALIARLLSPEQNMLHDDFIKRKFPKDFFDVAIGNPPFSQTQIFADPDYEKHGFMLHDFFFAKSIDRVRPGGLLAFVTSKGTMDKQTDKARKYLAARADLLGAIRLPSTAFEDNAGTSVVTDVIFLRKRAEGEAPAGEKWAGVASVDTKDGIVVVNEYFANHPEMVLGQNRISGNTDDMGRRINANGRGGEQYTVVSYDSSPAELDAKFAKAVERLPANVYSVLTQSTESVQRETAKVDFDPSVKREGVVYLAKDGTVMRVENGVGQPLEGGMKMTEADHKWFADYVGMRDLVQAARLAQSTDGKWEAALKKLNKAYDAFRAEHGPINDFRVQVRKSTDEEGNVVETESRVFKNRRRFREDYDSAILTQLETINEAGEIVKSPFLLGRTIGVPVTRDVKTIGDALAVSLDETGRLNLDDVGRRIGLTREEAIEALGNQVYRAPAGDWQLADEYLSGDVVSKLEEAEQAARLDDSLTRNVEALKAAQPEKLGPSQISAKLGASWIPAAHVNEFATEIGAGAVSFDPKTETWQVDGGNLRSQRRAGAEYGTAARSPSELLESALNSRSVKITTKVEGKLVTDQEATTAANEMLKKIKDKFKGWVWTDSERASELVESYNRRYNNIAPRRFDGSHLTLPGVSMRYNLHPHQKRAIWRTVQTGDTYLAHAVGSGKTIEMIASGMEQKRLGLIKKPMYVVPNHMLEQFANEFMELYPLANIMVADDENFSAERRKAFVASATLNNPDAVIITHDAFQRIGVKEESVAPIRDEILADLEIELSETAKDNGARVRRSQLEQQIEAVTQRFDRIIAAGGKDSTLKFEDIGVDFIFADEAHVFRKLDFHTAQQIKGIDPNGSKRALDMYVKTRWLQQQRPGRAMVFASGTPVTNTMGELYTIMRFFAPEEMDRAGISTFDAWARQFGEVAPALEPNAAGKYELIERFAKFDNVPELMSRVRQFMDVLTSEHLGALVKRPDLIGGKANLNIVQPSADLEAYMKNVLGPRIETSKKWKPTKDQPNNPDPIVSIITDGRFAAIDPRFFGGTLGDEGSIITEMGDKVVASYLAGKDNVYQDKNGKDEPIKGSTQVVFYNMGFGEQSQKNRGFNARAAFTKRLTDGGIPRDQIAWFDDANTDAKKEAVFKDMRSGKLRVLIGSAKKMGTGVNVQKRLAVLHYQDPPWFPADVEQPHGRIIRQGNQNAEVAIEWYTTKGTYQSTMWQMVGRKQRFIDQAFSGDKTLRSMEDMGEASLFEQAAAVASGDPRAIQLAGLKQEVERFERLQAAHASEQINVRSALRGAEWQVESAKKRINTLGSAFKAIGERFYAFTAGTIGGRTFDKVGEFGQAVKDAFNKVAADAIMGKSAREVQIGTLGDTLALTVDAEKAGKDEGEYTLYVTVGELPLSVTTAAGMGETVDAVGLGRRIVNQVNSISSDLANAKSSLTSGETDLIRLRKKNGAPFEYQQEMVEKYGELKRLEEELRLEGLAPAAVPIVINEDGSTAEEAAAHPVQSGEAEYFRGDANDFLPQLPAEVDAAAAVAAPLELTGREVVDAKKSTEQLNRQLVKAGMAPVRALRVAPSADFALARRIGEALGIKVNFVSKNGDFEGVAFNGTAYIADGTRNPALAIAGHETLHALEQSNPELGAKLRGQIRSYLNEGVVEDRQAREYAASGFQDVSRDQAEAEVIADINGAMWLDPVFWADLAKADRSLFRTVAYKFMELATKAINGLRGSRFDTSALVKDVAAVRAIMVSTWAEHNAGRDARSASTEGFEQPQNPRYNDPYATIQTRPNTVEAQREAGRGALADLSRRFGVDRIRDGSVQGGSTGSLLGSRMYANFVAGKPNQLVGQVARTPHELALLAQVYRDPRFETFRMFFTKGDTIVGEAGYSSRLPAVAGIPHGWEDRAINDMSRFGADGYYIIHNHPSGSPDPSTSDIAMTQKIGRALGGFRGHVIIDHNKYVVMDGTGAWKKYGSTTMNAVDFSSRPELAHQLLGVVVSGPDDVATIAKALQIPKGHGTMLLMSSDAEVQLVVDVPMGALTDFSKLGVAKTKALLRRMARESGSGGGRVIVLPAGVNAAQYRRWVELGVFHDVISADGSVASRTVKSGDDYLRQFGSRIFAVRETGKGAFERWFGDSMAVDETGAPLVVYHGTPTGGFSVFDKERQGSKGGRARGGFSFTTDYDAAETYAQSFGDESNTMDALLLDTNRIFAKDVRYTEALNEALYGDYDAQNPLEWSWQVIDSVDDLRDSMQQMAGMLEADGQVAAAAKLRAVLGKAVTGTPEVKSVYLKVPQGSPVYHATAETLGQVVKDLDVRTLPTRAAVVEMDDGSKVFYVADSEQIKSATDNNGDYDPNSPNIAFSRSGPNDAPARKPKGASRTGSAAFKAWFGNSKVVDADGKPLVVYHGTPNGGFSSFSDTTKGQRTGHSSDDVGYHFTSDPSYAEAYSEGYKLESIEAYRGMFGEEPAGTKMPPGAATYPVYLRLKNPLMVGASKQINKELIEHAKAEGHDGIIADMGGAREYVVFTPEQIKSATGNNGDFDAANPSILFSRTNLGDALASAAGSIADVRLPADYRIGDLFNSSGKISWWHKTIGTMENLAKRHPAFNRVYQAVQAFIGDVSRFAVVAADLAPTLLPKLENISDIIGKNRKKALTAEDTKAISAPIFEGTLVWARDEHDQPVKVAELEWAASSMTTAQKAQVLLKKGIIDDAQNQAWLGNPLGFYTRIIDNKFAETQLKAGLVWSTAELRSMFNLNDEQVGLYREFRDAIDKSLTNLTISEMVKMGGKDAKGLIEQAVAAPDLIAAGDLLRDHFMALAEMHPEQADMHLDTAKQILNLADKGQDLMDRGYAPLSRFGKYTVYVTEKDDTGTDQQVYFGMFETQYEASKMARDMAAEHPEARVQHGTISEDAFKLFAGVSPETIELFGSMVGLDNSDDPKSTEVYQTYLKLAKNNRSSMKRMIHRKGISGFSEDAGRVLAGFIYSNARLTAANAHLGEIDEAVTEIPKQQGELTDAAMQLREHIRNPEGGGSALGGMMFAQFLGGSVASAMVNLTQPFTMTLPYLSQWGGIAKAGKRLAAAVRLAGKESTGDEALDAALKWASDEGIVAPQEVHYLMAQAQGKGALQAGDGTKAGNVRAALNNTMSKVSLGWGKLFAMAELTNRRVTFIAAYRTAVEEGRPNPERFAQEAVSQTQGTYNAGNKPKWARGTIGSLLMTFKQFSIGYLELLSRMAFAGEPGSKERAAGRRAALYMVAVLFLMGGADGLPFEQDLEDALDGILQRMGFNFSTKRSKQAFLTDVLGQGGADFALKGISSMPGMPIDVSGRFGMGNLIPGTGLLKKKQSYTSDLGELAGPGGDIAKRLFTGAGKALGGDLAGAALDLSPAAVRNVVKGVDMLDTGTYRDARGYIVNHTTPGEAVMKMVGFQPNSTADIQDQKGQALDMIGQNRMRSTEIAEHWAQGLANKNPEMVQEAREMRADWNAKNPEAPIRIDMPAIIRRVRAMKEDAIARTQKTAPAALKQTVRHELASTRE